MSNLNQPDPDSPGASLVGVDGHYYTAERQAAQRIKELTGVLEDALGRERARNADLLRLMEEQRVLLEAAQARAERAERQLGADPDGDITDAERLAVGDRVMHHYRTLAAQLFNQKDFQISDLKDLARIDQLTGLGNRRRLNEALDNIIARTNREMEAFGVLCIDIDRFKDVNDTYGHSSGDAILKELARRLEDATRDGIDVVTRPGGEEFTIVIGTKPDSMTPDLLKKISEKIRRAVELEPFTLAYGRQIDITISVGGAVYAHASDDTMISSERTAEAARLLDRADAMLYESKNNGRNRTTIEESQLTEPQASAAE